MKGRFLRTSDSTDYGKKNNSKVATSSNLCNQNTEIAINNADFDSQDDQLSEQSFHWPK